MTILTHPGQAHRDERDAVATLVALYPEKGKKPGQIAKGWGRSIRLPKMDGKDDFLMVVKRNGTTSAIEIQNPTEADYYINNLPEPDLD